MDGKTLSDKIITADGLHHETKVCIEQDIKEFIKDIKEDLEKADRDADSDTGLSNLDVETIIDKRAGEGLR